MRRASEDALNDILRSKEGPERTARLVAWFQRLFGESMNVPVLVGGAALELYCGGAYQTGDLDFVGHVPPAVARELEESGFRKEGRHWIHEKGQVFIELPGSRLESYERVVEIDVTGGKVLALSPEDILVDRLAAWQFWRSSVDGANAFLLWSCLREELDLNRIHLIASQRGVERALEALLAFIRAAGEKDPSPEKVEAWALENL